MDEYIKKFRGFSTPYYIFYYDKFIDNYVKFENAFRSIYPKYQLAYSFKTNYTPTICGIVKKLGGYAEVVSDLEYTLAKKIGFCDEHIIYNGPGKGKLLETCLLNKGLLNVDNMSEVERVCRLAEVNRNIQLNIGIRVNFDIGNGVHSRFGINVENGDFQKVLNRINRIENVHVQGLHFHISQARDLNSWYLRIENILSIADKYFNYNLAYIDIGSGMFGDLDKELQKQFGYVPSYEEYANIVAGAMKEHYKDIDDGKKPILFTEPGATIISKYFHLFTSVLDIKNIGTKKYALLDCSKHNAGEICSLKKIPMRVIGINRKDSKKYDNVNFVGYTCLEHDILYENYSGELEKGDLIEFYNVGGYSIVSKPPFIHPDIPIYMYKLNEIKCIKRSQTLEDIFAPYFFEQME